ncbi:EAL domain-containing protein [Vibrio sp.]|nr:EAL domain-containing protein [Vibrio sp.]
MSQKDSVFEALQGKLDHQSTSVINVFETQLVELDSLIKQLLNSLQVTQYLNDEESSYAVYSTENQLIRFISNIAESSGIPIAIEFYDMQHDAIFSYNSENPFAKAVAPKGLIKHITDTTQSLSPEHSVSLITTQYDVITLADNKFQLNVYRTFSPEQSIYDNMFTVNSRLYTARISTIINVDKSILPIVQTAFSEQTTLHVLSHETLYAPNGPLPIQFQYDGLYHDGYARSPVIDTIISVDSGYINDLLFPYVISIISLVLNVTLVCFLLLKRLINRQIIVPIESLNEKVQKAINGDEKALQLIDKQDEVSSLNNSYIKLLDDLNTLARRDSLTGLANRNVFGSALMRSIEEAIQHSTRCALFYIDLDNFKSVNDQFGHHTGDKVLVEFSKQLTSVFRNEDIIVKPSLYSDIARLAGDEFAIVLPHAPSVDIISHIAQRIVNICENGLELDGIHYDVHTSIGIAVSPHDANDPDSLMKCADTAMYQVKHTSKNGFHFYSEELEAEQKRSSEIEKALKVALKNDEFYLHFMPIYGCQSGEIENIECLIRSNNDYLQQSGPDEYIPIAEHCGLIKEIDLWVFKTAISAFEELIHTHSYAGNISVNFSSYQLKDDNFVPAIKTILQETSVPTSKIDMEITETCLISNSHKVIERLNQLKETGVNLSLDDFGTGFTAFSQLQDYPVDSLKIDRSFVNLIDTFSEQQQEHRPLVDIIIELASLYELDTVAEGIESAEQFKYVSNLGCTQAQGFYLQKPVVWETLVTLLEEHDSNVFLKRIWPNKQIPLELNETVGSVTELKSDDLDDTPHQ